MANTVAIYGIELITQKVLLFLKFTRAVERTRTRNLMIIFIYFLSLYPWAIVLPLKVLLYLEIKLRKRTDLKRDTDEAEGGEFGVEDVLVQRWYLPTKRDILEK